MKNFDSGIDIDKENLTNVDINIDMVILEILILISISTFLRISISILKRGILQNMNIYKILYRLKFGILNWAKICGRDALDPIKRPSPTAAP